MVAKVLGASGTGGHRIIQRGMIGLSVEMGAVKQEPAAEMNRGKGKAVPGVIKCRAGQMAFAWLWAVMALVCAADRDISAREKPVAWKPVEDALLRVDDHPAKEWNLYQWGKKTDPLLLELNGRFLLLEVHDQRVYEIPASKIERKGTELMWAISDRPEKPLETANWTIRDVGLAYKVTLRLVAENHALDVQLPHPLDIRSVY